MMSKTFYASANAKEKALKNKKREAIQIGGDALFGIYATYWRFYKEGVGKLAKSFDTTRSTIESWLTFIILFSAVMVIISIVLYCKHRDESERLMQSYISISGDTIYGTAFVKDAKEPYAFKRPLREITNVAAMIGGGGTNLLISAGNKTYACYQIEDAPFVADYINNARKQLENEKNPQDEKESSRNVEKMSILCKNCGKALPAEAAFCDECGAEQ